MCACSWKSLRSTQISMLFLWRQPSWIAVARSLSGRLTTAIRLFPSSAVSVFVSLQCSLHDVTDRSAQPKCLTVQQRESRKKKQWKDRGNKLLTSWHVFILICKMSVTLTGNWGIVVAGPLHTEEQLVCLFMVSPLTTRCFMTHPVRPENTF